MHFTFTNDYTPTRLDEIVEYLLGPRLWIPQTDYPDFFDWADKAHRELKREAKRAMLALAGNEIVGITIYQRHKRYRNALEIKNLTVRPDHRGRHIASFIIRNTEIEGGKEFRASHVICDAKANNFAVRNFFFNHHYQILERTDLYNLGVGDDLVYHKNLLLQKS